MVDQLKFIYATALLMDAIVEKFFRRFIALWIAIAKSYTKKKKKFSNFGLILIRRWSLKYFRKTLAFILQTSLEFAILCKEIRK